MQQVDILNPYAQLEWRECRKLPVGMSNAQAVWLGDKLYVGGGGTSGSVQDAARLYIHTPTSDTWTRINTPVYWFALVTYHSELVLVGGGEYVGEGMYELITNKLWTLTEQDQWRETLPPMTRKCHSASSVDFANYILVAGGVDDEGHYTNIVEVYNGRYWSKAQDLPMSCWCMKSTIFNGHWYLMGGHGQEKRVYYASLDSLVASCQFKTSWKGLLSIWKRLPDVPHEHSSVAVFGNRLIAVRGEQHMSPCSLICAYSYHTRSWLHVGDMPVKLRSTCTTVLPTGDLMVIGGERGGFVESYVHKISLKGNS